MTNNVVRIPDNAEQNRQALHELLAVLRDEIEAGEVVSMAVVTLGPDGEAGVAHTEDADPWAVAGLLNGGAQFMTAVAMGEGGVE